MTPARGRRRRWLVAAAVLLLLAAALWLWWRSDAGSALTLDGLKAHRDALLGLYQRRPAFTLAAFFGVYVAATALSLPGATVLTLAAGAMFGFGTGLLVASFASSIGATLAFLASRHLLRDSVRSRFGDRLKAIDAGLRRDGALYLLTLRLVPVFPFFLVNLLAGLTPIAPWRYYWVSQLGMLAATAAYVNAGTRLAGVERLADALSPQLVASFALLGVLPFAGKALAGALRRRRLYARWTRPRRYDRNLVVIGAGAGGLVAAYVAAAAKAKVTLVEQHAMGGDCLNAGCVPSKALLRSARAAKELQRAAALGLRGTAGTAGTVDFAAVMARVQQVIGAIAPHDSAERYAALGVEVIAGRARIVTPWRVDVDGADGRVHTLTTRAIVVATGARPLLPPIPGLAEAGCLTSDTVWQLRELPRRLLVLGGGPVGCELAQAFARLGAQVTLVEAAPRLLPREDGDAAALVGQSLRADGVRVLAGHRALRCEGDAHGPRRLVVGRGEAGDEDASAIDCDALLCAVGRAPRTAGFGLEDLGIALTPRGTIETDAYLRTSLPNIFAVGDVAGPWQLTHAAAHQGWHAAANALFGGFFWRFRADRAPMPRAAFTDPELAQVGLTQADAEAQGIAFEVARHDFADLDRALTDDAARGFVKVLTAPGSDRLLGVTIVGEQAGELIAEFALAMKHRLGLKAILASVHAYPTLAEANQRAAGAWQRAHAPQRLLAWAERLHRWQRS